MSHLGDRLSALVDGELDGAERDRAHAHLAGCERCRTAAAEHRAQKKQLRGLTDGAPAEAAMTRRLIAMTGPGGPVPPRRRLLRVVPGRRLARPGTAPGSAPSGPGRRRRRYLVLGTVRSRIHRGRAQLRTALEHRRPAPGGDLGDEALHGAGARRLRRRPGLVPLKRAGEP